MANTSWSDLNKDLWDISVEYECMAKLVQVHLHYGNVVEAYRIMNKMENKKWDVLQTAIPFYLERLR